MNTIVEVATSPDMLASCIVAVKRDEMKAAEAFTRYRAELLSSSWARETLRPYGGAVVYRAAAAAGRSTIDAGALRARLERAAAALGRLAVACPGHAVDILAVQRLLTVPMQTGRPAGETIIVQVSP